MPVASEWQSQTKYSHLRMTDIFLYSLAKMVRYDNVMWLVKGKQGHGPTMAAQRGGLSVDSENDYAVVAILA